MFDERMSHDTGLARTTSNVTIFSKKDFYDNRQLIKILHWFSK